MKVYLRPQAGLSRAMDRVANALTRYAPGHVTVTTNRDEADLVVLHVIGYPETQRAVEQAQARGQKYVIIQYCLRTTQRPSPSSWLPLWTEAALVWSYYDLEAFVRQECAFAEDTINWYCSPLGADSATFVPINEPKLYTILTSGYVAETEGVLEAARAVARVGGRHFHLGPNLHLRTDSRTEYELGITDSDLARRYSQSHFVAGLRRVEGFELPAAEGLLCGARPIMFDRPHYRRWFDGLAVFINEGSPDEVTDELTQIFQRGADPVTPEERMEAAERFSWQRITNGFWERLCA